MERKQSFQRHTPLKRKTALRVQGTSGAARLKRDIQDELRRIVIARDGGCILRHSYDVSSCGGFDKSGQLILQADHLIERSNSATYADPRLVVTLCKGHHGWKHFKKSNHDRYNAIVRELLPTDRAELWDRCEKDSWRPARTSASDWGKELAYLRTL